MNYRNHRKIIVDAAWWDSLAVLILLMSIRERSKAWFLAGYPSHAARGSVYDLQMTFMTLDVR